MPCKRHHPVIAGYRMNGILVIITYPPRKCTEPYPVMPVLESLKHRIITKSIPYSILSEFYPIESTYTGIREKPDIAVMILQTAVGFRTGQPRSGIIMPKIKFLCICTACQQQHANQSQQPPLYLHALKYQLSVTHFLRLSKIPNTGGSRLPLDK